MVLAQHIGVNYSDSFQVKTLSLDVMSPESIYRNPSDALVSRNEYIMLNKAVDAEILQRNIARGEYLPSLAIGVQGLYLDYVEQQNTYGLAFATLSVPISGWWGGSHKMNEHKIRVKIAENNLEEKSELMLVQINKTYSDMLESYSQIDVAEITREQSEEHLNVVQDNYDAGVVGTSDLLEAQAMYQQTQDTLVDAKTVYKIKQAYYLQAISKLKK
jgi:outer membrane protein TolC